MVQTVVITLMILAGAVVVEANSGALGTPVTLALPGMASVTLTVLEIILVAVGALVVGWLAGQIDRAILAWRVRRREGMLRDAQVGMARMSATVSDGQPGVMNISLTNIHKRLDMIEQQSGELRRRVDDVRERHAVVNG